MKFNTITGRIAATGAVAALAAAGLVGASTTAAQADPVDLTYTCPTPVGDISLALTTDVPALAAVSALPPFHAGEPVAAGQVPGGVTNHFTISDTTKQTLDAVGTSKIDFTAFAGELGNSAIPADLPDVMNSDLTQNSDGSWSFDADGPNMAFNMPAAGTYDVLAPATFAFTATTGAGNVPVTCASDAAPGNYGHQITVVKNDSTTSGHAKAVVKGNVSKVKIRVKADNHTPSGKVVVKKGTKTLGKVKLNKNGVATFKQKFKKTTKLTLKYTGDSYTNKSTGTAKAVVKR